MYSASKHAIIGLVTSVAAYFPGELRANVVLPGLVDTPFTWNQMRGKEVFPNGTLWTKYPLQPAWQCVVDGKVIEDGDCSGGGTGYGCPCEDLRRDDPRLRAALGKAGLWPPLDPRLVGAAVLDLANPTAVATGVSRVVNTTAEFQCKEDSKQKMWEQCPLVRGKNGSDATLV